MLTARDAASDIVLGLDCGADDYLTKPFSFEVFLARIRAVSRRGPEVRPVCYQIGDLLLNSATREVRRGTRPIELTAREFSLLELLMKRSPRVLARDAIFEAVWGFDGDVTENNIEAFIHRLRAKLNAKGDTRLIHTVRGVGYCLREQMDP
jgi:two-component system response regulator MprA